MMEFATLWWVLRNSADTKGFKCSQVIAIQSRTLHFNMKTNAEDFVMMITWMWILNGLSENLKIEGEFLWLHSFGLMMIIRESLNIRTAAENFYILQLISFLWLEQQLEICRDFKTLPFLVDRIFVCNHLRNILFTISFIQEQQCLVIGCWKTYRTFWASILGFKGSPSHGITHQSHINFTTKQSNYSARIFP